MIKELFSLIYSDYCRYINNDDKNTGNTFGVLLLTQGFWASFIYRFSHAIVRGNFLLLKRPLRILFLFIEKWVEIITGIRIPGECTIGKGLYIGHFGHIILNDRVVLGDYCNLSQGVTIGKSHRGDTPGVPTLGHRVYIGPNAVIFGNIIIGSDVAIGAGAVVARSFKDRSVIAGNPAKLISYNGSFDMVRYDGMLQDVDRLSSISMLNDEE